jgi:hypothetical protein
MKKKSGQVAAAKRHLKAAAKILRRAKAKHHKRAKHHAKRKTHRKGHHRGPKRNKKGRFTKR